MIPNMSKKIQKFFRIQKRALKGQKIQIFQKFFNNEFPMLTLVGFDTLFVKKIQIFFQNTSKMSKKGTKKTKMHHFLMKNVYLGFLMSIQ